MRGGRLRHRVTIQVSSIARSATTNAPTKTWATYSNYTNVPAGIEPLRGRELEASAQRQSETVMRIILRYLPGITSGMRVLDDRTGTVYDIVEILNENERNRELALGCATGLRSG